MKMQINMNDVAEYLYTRLDEMDQERFTVRDLHQKLIMDAQQMRRHLNNGNAAQQRSVINWLSNLHTHASVQLKSKLYHTRDLIRSQEMAKEFQVRFIEAVLGAAQGQLDKFDSMWQKYCHVVRRLDFFDTRLSQPDIGYDVLAESENPAEYVFVPPPRARPPIYPDAVSNQWRQYCEQRIAARERRIVGRGDETAESVYADPIAFWKSQEDTWSELSRIALYWLQIQTSSVSAERVFSVMRYHVNAHRSSLTPEHVDNEMVLLTNPSITNTVCGRHEAEWQTVWADDQMQQLAIQ